MDSPDLKAPQHYINRELSLLEFNQRVLAQALRRLGAAARAAEVPVHLLAATSMSSSRSASRASSSCRSSARRPDRRRRLSLDEQLAAIHERATRLVADQYRCLNEVLLPALHAEGIRCWRARTGRPQTRRVARAVLRARGGAGAEPARARSRAPVPAHPEQEPELHRAAAGQGCVRPRQRARHRAGAALAAARGPAAAAPAAAAASCCSRPSCTRSCSKLFAGMEVLGCYQFRVTRNSDLFVDEEEIDDLRRALEGELAQRRYGAAVRLETSQRLPRGHGGVPAAAVRARATGSVPGAGPGEPEPPLGHLRPGRAAGPEIPAVHARHCRSGSPAPPTSSR